MLVSTKGRYGLRVLIEFAEHDKNESENLFSACQRGGC